MHLTADYMQTLRDLIALRDREVRDRDALVGGDVMFLKNGEDATPMFRVMAQDRIDRLNHAIESAQNALGITPQPDRD